MLVLGASHEHCPETSEEPEDILSIKLRVCQGCLVSESAEAASALGESAARLLDTRLSNDALVSLLVAVSPSIPGFLVQVKALNVAHVPPPLINRYNQAWFVGFAIAFVVYLFYGS